MILVDMEMPESCEKCNMQYICKVRDNVGGVVGFHKMNLDKNRHPDCPIKTEIPDDVTNGDMIKALFTDCRYEHEKRKDLEWGHLNFDGNTCSFQVDDKWWNAPYKAESKEKSI